MRISDWSSDVCSSDLLLPRRDDPSHQLLREKFGEPRTRRIDEMVGGAAVGEPVFADSLRKKRRGHDDAFDLDLRIGDKSLNNARGAPRAGLAHANAGLALIDRKSVVQGQWGSERETPGGSPII